LCDGRKKGLRVLENVAEIKTQDRAAIQLGCAQQINKVAPQLLNPLST